MTKRHIVAGSVGLRRIEGGQLRFGSVLRYALGLSKSECPRLGYIGTAKGDTPEAIVAFYNACSFENVSASHLQLFPFANHENIKAYVDSLDVIFVDWGSVANMLAVWRIHGLDAVLREAWEKGVIITGQSAGAICWSSGGTTDSFGLALTPFTDALGWLPYSCGVHYDSEPRRRPLFQRLIAEQKLPEGYATDDGVNLHFMGTELHQAVSDTPDKYAYHVYHNDDGAVVEDRIQPVLLTS